jgi:hypothetical protein
MAATHPPRPALLPARQRRHPVPADHRRHHPDPHHGRGHRRHRPHPRGRRHLGWTVSTAFLETKDASTVLRPQLAGAVTFEGRRITFNGSKNGTDARTVFTRGQSGFIIIGDAGVATGKKADVYPVTVGAVAKLRNLDSRTSRSASTSASPRARRRHHDAVTSLRERIEAKARRTAIAADPGGRRNGVGGCGHRGAAAVAEPPGGQARRARRGVRGRGAAAAGRRQEAVAAAGDGRVGRAAGAAGGRVGSGLRPASSPTRTASWRSTTSGPLSSPRAAWTRTCATCPGGSSS